MEIIKLKHSSRLMKNHYGQPSSPGCNNTGPPRIDQELNKKKQHNLAFVNQCELNNQEFIFDQQKKTLTRPSNSENSLIAF